MSAVTATGGPRRRPLIRRKSAIPGYGLTMGVTLTVLSVVVLIPLSAVAIEAAGLSPREFLAAAFSQRAVAAYRLSFGAALIAAAINGVFGLLTAWALVRYEFPGKAFINAIVDLPFALPTAVAGISLAALYAPNGWVGQILDQWGVKAAYNPTGVVIALTFIGLPFVVRTLEPVMRDLAADVEEAAASLGASRLQTILRVVLPALAPAWLTGFAMAFARGVGEYGLISGQVEPSDFRNAVGGARIKRRMFMLRDFRRIAEHFAGSGKVEATMRGPLFQGGKDEMGAIDISADGRKFILKGVADKTLRSQMVTFIWLHPVDHLEEAGIAV